MYCWVSLVGMGSCCPVLHWLAVQEVVDGQYGQAIWLAGFLAARCGVPGCTPVAARLRVAARLTLLLPRVSSYHHTTTYVNSLPADLSLYQSGR
jgi:hypothetical protein